MSSPAKKPERGKRSGVTLNLDTERNQDGLEPEDSYFDDLVQSLSYQPNSPSVNSSGSKATPAKIKSILKQRRIRFALPLSRDNNNNTTENDEETTIASTKSEVSSKTGQKLQKLARNQVISPSELSQVSTAPPSTDRKSAIESVEEADDDNVDNLATDSPLVEQNSPESVNNEAISSPLAKDKVVEDTSDDVDDDLLPPPPPTFSDEEEEDNVNEGSVNKSKTVASLTPSQQEILRLATQPDRSPEGNVLAASSSSPLDIGDFDDDDDDKEGDGYELRLASPPASSKSRRKGSITPRVSTPDAGPDTPLADDNVAKSPRVLNSRKKTKAKRASAPKRQSPSSNDDDDDSIDNPVTPDSRAVRKTKQTKRQRSSPESDSSVEQKRRKAKKKTAAATTKRNTAFSPRGVQSGPREFEAIPVTDLKDKSPRTSGTRRSQRAKIKPLEFWKNERYIYGPNDFDMGDGYVGVSSMPVPKAVSIAQPTPYKKRKYTPPARTDRRESKQVRETAKSPSPEKQPFDASKIKKKYKYSESDNARIWDESNKVVTEAKVISYGDDMEERDLPLVKSRSKSDGKVVGRAAQAFNIPNKDHPSFAGYIAGHLSLPPKGIKDAESTGSCTQIFTVVSCQPNACEVDFADPDEEEGVLNPKTAQRYLLQPGDIFRVPPSNCYRLQNHSKDVDAVLTWTIILPVDLINDEDR